MVSSYPADPVCGSDLNVNGVSLKSYKSNADRMLLIKLKIKLKTKQNQAQS